MKKKCSGKTHFADFVLLTLDYGGGCCAISSTIIIYQNAAVVAFFQSHLWQQVRVKLARNLNSEFANILIGTHLFSPSISDIFQSGDASIDFKISRSDR